MSGLRWLLGLGLVFLPRVGWAALSCDDILNMVNVNVPSSIIVDTMMSSGDPADAALVACLVKAGAPEEVLAEARREAGIEAPPASPSTALKLAKTLVENKKPLSASMRLYELLEAGDPSERVSAEYYLAEALFGLEMYSAAELHFYEVAKELVGGGSLDSPYLRPTLERLVGIMRRTGDPWRVRRLVTKLSPDQLPRGIDSPLYYQLGVLNQESAALVEALQFLDKVSDKSNWYTQAKVVQGAILHAQGKQKSAVKAFRDAAVWPISENESAEDQEAMRATRDLAVLNIGRLYYEVGYYDRAADFFGIVYSWSLSTREAKKLERMLARDPQLLHHRIPEPKDPSPYLAESRVERAWALFMLDRDQEALALLDAVLRPGRDGVEPYQPEAELLRGTIQLGRCEYAAAEASVSRFRTRYVPIYDELYRFVKGYSSDEGKQNAGRAWTTWFGPTPAPDTLPPQVLALLTSGRELRGVRQHLASIDQDIAKIDLQTSPWKESVGAKLKKELFEERARVERRLGLLLLSQSAHEANRLSSLREQMNAVELSAIDAQRRSTPLCGP